MTTLAHIKTLVSPVKSPRGGIAALHAAMDARRIREANAMHRHTIVVPMYSQTPPPPPAPALELVPLQETAPRRPPRIPRDRECHLPEFLAYLVGLALLVFGGMAGVVYALVG